ncbi:ATP-binding protein [Streptomyces sp. NBC_00094]|uniref:ATP-binding protein n=1 Tax=Streptomyces sp. NBC_00094 TaxID=2903620 RepID=UPI002253696F|nr:ATP-binding protein [Streptomyces sp. NBC_00094]MCX5393731.1 ATP-binding protein [Streptomyces sp. NBC_00094]
MFSQLLSGTRRGARLARLLAVTELRTWNVPPDVTERAEQIVAELAANAVLHGRVPVPGRGFRLRLLLGGMPRALHIEVTDARGDRLPALPEGTTDGEGSRGLLLVNGLADRWGVVPFPPGGKTVWAAISLAPGSLTGLSG